MSCQHKEGKHGPMGPGQVSRYDSVLQNGLMAFIAESVDSRNHVIVALAVTAGLAASLLRFGLLDMLVGLAVAV